MKEIERIRNNITKYFEDKDKAYEAKRAHIRNKKWSKYYQNAEWKKIREHKYNDTPCCEICEKLGYAVPADAIHHLRPYGNGETQQEKKRLLLDYNNLCSCCNEHHKQFHYYMRTYGLDYLSPEDLIRYMEQDKQ